MTVITLDNPKALPAGDCVGVQDGDDASAIRHLLVIVRRRGVTIGDKVYKWGNGYYYAEIQKES